MPFLYAELFVLLVLAFVAGCLVASAALRMVVGRLPDPVTDEKAAGGTP